MNGWSERAARRPAGQGGPAERGGVEALLGALGSLADPTRLRVLALLERHELGVVELAEVLRLPQSSVSRHLQVLAAEGWLRSRREGTAHLHRLAPELDVGAGRLWKLARAEASGWAALDEDAERLEARLAARRDAADAFFSGAAPGWERLRGELYGRGFAVDAALALLPDGLTVVDLGCGTGDLLARVAPRAARAIGIDRSAAMLKVARRRLAGLAHAELHRADLEALPLEDASCDAAFLLFGLIYVAEPAPVLAEAARVLRPGGRLAVVDLARHADDAFRERMGQAHLGFEADELAALLAGAGLEPSCTPLASEPGARGPALLLGRGLRRATPRDGARPRRGA